jgi:hypothetical protein
MANIDILSSEPQTTRSGGVNQFTSQGPLYSKWRPLTFSNERNNLVTNFPLKRVSSHDQKAKWVCKWCCI